MSSALLATLSLVASAVLHVLLFLGLMRSASGAEPGRDELEPARFVGDTFEIDTLDAPPLAGGEPARVAPGSPAPETPSAATTEPPSAATAAPPTEPTERTPSIPPTEPIEPSEPALPPTAPPLDAPEPGETPQPPGLRPEPRLPSSTGASPAPPAPGGDVGSAAPPGAASQYGQDVLPASTASFAKAFTRAVPRIASADKVWHGLPLGAAGSAVFSIEVDDRGKVVGQGTLVDKPVPAPHLARIIGRTVLLLRNQTFAHAADAGAPVSQRFELSAEIRQVAPLEDTFAEPADLRQIGRLVEPTRVRPGKANFTYNSGRQVELTVRLLNP